MISTVIDRISEYYNLLQFESMIHGLLVRSTIGRAGLPSSDFQTMTNPKMTTRLVCECCEGLCVLAEIEATVNVKRLKNDTDGNMISMLDTDHQFHIWTLK